MFQGERWFITVECIKYLIKNKLTVAWWFGLILNLGNLCVEIYSNTDQDKAATENKWMNEHATGPLISKPNLLHK